MNALDVAMEELRAGRPIVVPTDTVYGIAVLPSVPGAIDEVYRIKGRPAHKPIPVLGPELEQLSDIVTFSPQAKRLAEVFWPGPLTMVLPRRFTFTADLGGAARQDDVAVRVPRHDLCLDLLRRAGLLAVTSANLSGAPPATTAGEAREMFDDQIDVVLDGGTCDGAPSSVVRVGERLEVLRLGALDEEELARALG